MQKGDCENAIRNYKMGLEVLKRYPEKNNTGSVKADSEKALIYIREMEERIKSKR
jgi:hypothetical protein